MIAHKLFPLISFLVAILSFNLDAQVRPSGVKPVEASEGTVNIILAQGSTLVAITDSMLTYGGSGRHEPLGTKLFQIDDVTICAMAGLYSQPGPQGSSTFAFDVPTAMRQFTDHERIKGRDRLFWQKAWSLISEFQGQLSNSLQASVTENPDFDISSVSPLELTLAGYDLDGSLKIAEITLVPERLERRVHFKQTTRDQLSIFPQCRLSAEIFHEPIMESRGGSQPTILRVGERIFCETAGIPDVANSLLDGTIPEAPEMAFLQKAMSQNEKLSAGELQKVALYLEQETMKDEIGTGRHRVGGAPNIALLREGRIAIAPNVQPLTQVAGPETGRDLQGPSGEDIVEVCNASGNPAIVFTNTPRGTPLQIRMTGCRHSIDEIVYHDSVFTNDVLTYLGVKPLLFADSNVVVGSVLILGPKVDRKESDVRHLMCSFRWKAVYQGQTNISHDCISYTGLPLP